MKLAGLFFALILASTLSFADEPKTVADYLALAHQKEASSDYADAIAIYDAILEQFPKEFAGVYLDRAEDLCEIKNYEKAILDFDKALALDTAENPHDPAFKHGEVFKERAQAKEHVGDRTGAISDYTQALALDPKDFMLLSNRADNKLRLGDCAGAISDYSSALTLLPGSVYYEDRAIGRICTGDLQGAFEDYHHSTQMSNELDASIPQHVVHGTDLGAWALGVYLGHKDGADAQLLARLTAATKPADIGQEYDAARYFLGQADESILFRDATALKAKDPKFAESYESNAYYYAGLKQIANGNKAEALKDLQKGLEYHRHMITVVDLTNAWIAELNRHPH
jgi:tetratricopeptide (TPR) repeat protein